MRKPLSTVFLEATGTLGTLSECSTELSHTSHQCIFIIMPSGLDFLSFMRLCPCLSQRCLRSWEFTLLAHYSSPRKFPPAWKSRTSCTSCPIPQSLWVGLRCKNGFFPTSPPNWEFYDCKYQWKCRPAYFGIVFFRFYPYLFLLKAY